MEAAKQIQAQVAGGEIKLLKNMELRLVKDLRAKLGLGNEQAATINGEPADDNQELRDYDFVAFAPKVAGGQ